MKNKRERIHDWLRRSLALLMALVMVVTMLPLHAFADDFLYDNMDKEKSGFINQLEVAPAKPKKGESAADLIKNPKMPEIYTLRTDYKVRKNHEWKINYQPYVASVGENATPEEKDKVKKTIDIPDLKGYGKPIKTTFDITYDGVVNEAKAGSNQGVYWQKNKDVRYEPKDSIVKVKHVFQSLTDFNEYGRRDGEANDKYTDAIGKTGNLLEVQALDPDTIPGFEAEADVLTTMVPEDTSDFVVEYRYNRKSYDVDYNTEGGTDVASRLLYYGQKIPGAEEPTKNGSIFLGWKPSCELKGEVDGIQKTFPQNEVIKNAAGDPIKNLKDANLIMPAKDVVFTAKWKDGPKADYLIQFWTEKPDYDDKDDKLPLRERYDFIGSRRVEDADTGLRPDLTNLSIKGITFPDLNDGRLEKAQNDPKEFARYYFLNEALTKKQNASEKDPTVQKSVLSTGETVYNVYYDRRVYTLYFTSTNNEYDDYAYWPIITKDGQVLGKEGAPYKVDVRFNQSLDKIWPKDEEISGLPKGDSTEPTGDDGLIGWMINHNNNDNGVSIFRDTPPYRLSAEDFIDAKDVMSTEDESGGKGHADKIPIGENETKDRGEYEISLGASYIDTAIAYHIDIIKDDFEGKEQIDYDMSYWKSDTNTYDYEFILPHLQGFTLKKETRPAQLIGKIKVGDVEKTFDELNAERNEKTPFRSDDDKIEYISHFPWSQKLFDGTNAYDYANYYRNKYKLKLNNDPKAIKNDNEYTDGKDRFDVFYEMPLKNLDLDNKQVPKKPDWVPDNWEFKGWALDPAGENLLKYGDETKLHYDQFLFAKWDEPNYKWKLTVDPHGGEMKNLTVDDIMDKRVTNNRGEAVQDVAKKEDNDGDRQIFTVNHRQRLQNPGRPKRKGYNFLGWELVRYKDGKEDGSYKRDYHVPELYAFSNDMVSDVYLRAIWLKNDRVDVPVYHHFIDSEGNEIKPLRDPFIIEDARVGYYTVATATAQDAEWILMPHEELEALTDDNPVKQQYVAYNEVKNLNNADFHSLRVEPKTILKEGKEEKNPKAKNNVFHFYYRRFRTRNYKVNYLDERAKAELEKATTADEKQAIIKKYRIIPQENVESKNRHFDARNYRPIPGWKLSSNAQQQLFYDVEEDTNALLGINGTGKDEITFYYKDVRVIEVPDPKEPVPKGYVRVTFKADKGGSFTDNTGKSVKELHYDVIKGLKSHLIPVPKELKDGEIKEAGKYYITPEAGKAFTKWDEKPLLNKNTLLENEDEGAYTFTAFFEWSGLTASGLVRTEAFKDPNGNWTNAFAPTIEELKKQLVWKEKDQVKDLPAGTVIKLYDEADNELKSDEDVFKLVKEQNKEDKDQLVRTVNIKAKVTFTDGKDPQELDIPITVYKNVYEALNKAGDKPLFLKEAEGKEAKDGGLKDVTGDYVMVTVKASKDFNAKDDKIYYVNKNAWVEIPEVKTEGSSTFVNWTADKAAQNEGQAENGIFDFGKRHKFTDNTVISPSDAKDVVEQKQGEDKPKVPDNYVKVIVKTTDKATDETAFEKTFWVNSKADVTIPVANPTGKTVAADPANVGAVGYTMKFSKWQSEETTPRTWADRIVGKFEKDTTIVAKYSVTPEKIKDQVPTTDTVHTPQGKTPTVDQIKEKITPPEGKTIKTVTIVENPDVNNPGESKVKVIVEYTDGSSVGTDEKPVEIPVEVHKNIIPANPDGTKPKDALDNYVKVTFKAGTGGTVSGDLVYYVSPEVEVDMTASAEKITKTPSVGYINGDWNTNETKKLKDTFKADTEFTFNFVKTDDIVEKTDDSVKKPEGYVTVKFTAGENGKIKGGDKTYYVNPEANIKLVDKDKATAGAKNELVIPETEADANYAFEKWVETIDYTDPIKGDREYVAKFKLAKVTLTYEANGAEGTVPPALTVDHGTTVRLAGPGQLKKDNAVFAGWKIGDKTYQAADEVTLTENTKAIAQWNVSTHTVMFNSMGGTTVETQMVNHGGNLKAFDAPTLDGKVFMGWKEKGKENQEGYFDLTQAINEDKVLVAQWQAPVQKIDENEPVEEQFIKVTFNQGDHGTLIPDKDKQDVTAATVTYKVAKDYTFDDAIKHGLVVPGIAPAKYYKAKDANSGWDKELKLEGQNATFTAQYEPIADVIPIDPNVTPDEKLQDDKPEGMVLVQFKVADDTKFYLDKNVKYYVKQDAEVRIPTPVVLNKNIGEAFKGWKDVNVVNEPIEATQDPNAKTFEWVKQSFKTDTTITDEHLVEPKIFITAPKAGAKIVYIEILDGDIGKLQVVGHDRIYENTKYTRRGKSYRVFKLDQALKIGDGIRYWAEAGGKASMVKENVIQ